MRTEHKVGLINRILDGNFNLSCSHPLTEVESMIDVISRYTPYKEEQEMSRAFALDRLRKWKEDLILGNCKY